MLILIKESLFFLLFHNVYTNSPYFPRISEIDYLIRFVVVILSIVVFYLTKKNLVYPTLFSAIILSLLSSYL